MRIKVPNFLALAVAISPAFAQPPPPRIGSNTVGDEYFVANYTQLLDYWNNVVKETDRMKLVEIGKTAEGRPIMMAIIISPANHKKPSRYEEISQRLARAEGLTDEQAQQLAAEGKAVVWIDGGLRANEPVNAQAIFTAHPAICHAFIRNTAATTTIATPSSFSTLSIFQERHP